MLSQKDTKSFRDFCFDLKVRERKNKNRKKIILVNFEQDIHSAKNCDYRNSLFN